MHVVHVVVDGGIRNTSRGRVEGPDDGRTNGSILRRSQRRTIISTQHEVLGHGRLRLGRGLRNFSRLHAEGVFIEVQQFFLFPTVCSIHFPRRTIWRIILISKPPDLASE